MYEWNILNILLQTFQQPNYTENFVQSILSSMGKDFIFFHFVDKFAKLIWLELKI